MYCHFSKCYVLLMILKAYIPIDIVMYHRYTLFRLLTHCIRASTQVYVASNSGNLGLSPYTYFTLKPSYHDVAPLL